jgi:hypothetical protein
MTDGSDSDCGAGTVYELSPGSEGWTEQVLHNFGDYFNTSDGSCPAGGVMLDGMGNIFGTIQGGGTDIVGTIFELSPGSPGSPTPTPGQQFPHRHNPGSPPDRWFPVNPGSLKLRVLQAGDR